MTGENTVDHLQAVRLEQVDTELGQQGRQDLDEAAADDGGDVPETLQGAQKGSRAGREAELRSHVVEDRRG